MIYEPRAALSAGLNWIVFKAPVWFTIVWLVAGVALCAVNTWMVQHYVELVDRLFIILVSVGGVAAVSFLLMSFVRGYFLILCAIIALSMISFWYGYSIISRIADQLAFNFIRAPYDEAVAKAEKPVLIAFPWRDPEVGGTAIVYDQIDSLNGYTAQAGRRVSPSLRKMIGGDPYICFRFADPHYYICRFS